MTVAQHRTSNNQDMTGTTILCSCPDCRPGRREKLGEIHPGYGLSLADKRHGTTHRVELTAREMLCWLSGTRDGSAIQQYVAQVLG